jgi:starch synthase
MIKKLKVLYVSSEVVPFAKTGGLADVAGALPMALKDLGHEVRVMMPKYKIVNERKYVLREVIRLKNIPVKVGEEEHQVNVKSAFIPDSKVQIYFIDYKPFFGREGLYVDGKRGKDFPDNDQRFILFSKAVLETLKLLYWQPDIIHINDWHCSLIPLYLKSVYAKDPFFKKISSILTIHNVGYQGNFSKETGGLTGIPKSALAKEPCLDNNGFNFLANGILSADYINTVSKTYAKEIRTNPELGHGMEELLTQRKKEFTGILNGVDYSVWNPETDPLIAEPYNAKSLAPKEENKIALMKRVGLPYKKGTPVFGLISRLVPHKGHELLIEALPELLKLDAQFILLGTGDKNIQAAFAAARKEFDQQFSATFGFNEKLAHLIEAGCDAYLMPSLYEPCGLNQMYSLKYGTVPVVRETGGLADTVENFTSKTGTGNGITFPDFTAASMLTAVKRAIKLYNSGKSWQKIVRNGMKQDFSWNAAAKQYTRLYTQVVKSK